MVARSATSRFWWREDGQRIDSASSLLVFDLRLLRHERPMCTVDFVTMECDNNRVVFVEHLFAPVGQAKFQAARLPAAWAYNNTYSLRFKTLLLQRICTCVQYMLEIAELT